MGKVIGVTMVKDEVDIVGTTVEHMLKEVDEVIVLDNGSSDGTRETLFDLSSEGRLTLIDDPEVGYYQSAKMTELARMARQKRAAWVVPFDADEVWMSPFGAIADVLNSIGGEYVAAAAELHDHVPTGIDWDLKDPVARMTWRRTEPALLPKVAVRTGPNVLIEQGNHGVTVGGVRPAYLPGHLVVHHYPYRSAEQFVRKARNGAAAYAATDLPEDAGAHWRGYGRILERDGEEACASIFRTWFWQPDARGLVQCPA